MNVLRRESAPLSGRAWEALDEAAATAARHVLAGRRIATFDGPRGWEHLAARLGTMTPCTAADGQATVCVPDVALLAEIRAEFALPWTAVEVFERGAPALATQAAESAARAVALAEDRLAFYGDPIGHGFLASKESPRLQIEDWNRAGQLLVDLSRAVEKLDALGIAGPYEAVLSPARYYAYLHAMPGGYPVPRHVREFLAAVHHSPVMREPGAVFSTRGGDFVVTVGGDLATGYRFHDGQQIHLVCVETLAAQTMSPEAVCLLVE